MKFVDEYRDLRLVEAISKKIRKATTKEWRIMEVCGGQTHSIMKYDLNAFLPSRLSLIHGPGCPVCVTPLEKIDRALEVAAMPNVIFTSFGDMLRVPGSEKDLLTVKAEGGDVRIVYSPLDALKIAADNPDKQVVFFAIGFETTAPANALSVIHAKKMGLINYSILSSHVLVPPAMELILSSEDNQINGFLAAGHVCTVMGYNQYIPIAEKFHIPIAVTGFEPVDILGGILAVVHQLEEGTNKVTNEYARSVKPMGNELAQESIWNVFEPADMAWRGIGLIPLSGLRIKDSYAEFDAENRFSFKKLPVKESQFCIAGKILKGQMKPNQCSAFGYKCTPEKPLGAPMVSQEGVCNAYYRYQHN